MPASHLSRRHGRLMAGRKDLRNQAESMSNSVKVSTSSANTKNSNDDACKSNEHASLAQGPSKDHTESTRSTQESSESNDSSRCRSEETPDLKKVNAAPGPASVEYSMAPSSEKLSTTKRKVPKTSRPPLSMRKTKGLVKTPKTRKNRGKEEPIIKRPGLPTISKPGPKYFTYPPASPQSSRSNEHLDKDIVSRHEASADDDDGFTLGIASTITSAPDMPPAPTVDSEGEESSDWSSRDEEGENGPPMSTIGEESHDSSDSDSSESTVCTKLQREKLIKAREKRLKEIHDGAVRLMRKGELDLALSKFEDIRDVLTEEYYEEHHRVAASLHNIGIMEVRRGEAEEASSIFRKAVRIKKERLGKYHPKVTETLLELGLALLLMKKRDEALAVFTEALKICRRDARKEFFLGGKDVQLSKILNNIGVVHFECGRGTNATKAFEEALKIQQYISKKGGDELSVSITQPMAHTIYNIACVHVSCEEHDEAIESLDLANSLQESILGKSNPIVLNTLENLAYCNAKEGFLTVAMSIYEEILSQQESAHGIYALPCAATRRNIACIHIANCKYDKALECMRVVQSIQERHLGPESRRLHNTTTLIRALVKKKTTFLSPSELMRREVSRLGAAQFLCAAPPDLTTVAEKGGLEELAELRRPPMQCKISGHKIVYA